LSSSLILSFWWWMVNGMNYKAPHFDIFCSLPLRVLYQVTIFWTIPCLYFSLQVQRTTLSRTTSAFSHHLSGSSSTQNVLINLNTNINKLCVLPTDYTECST
jgi:hypothetical protein